MYTVPTPVSWLGLQDEEQTQLSTPAAASRVTMQQPRRGERAESPPALLPPQGSVTSEPGTGHQRCKGHSADRASARFVIKARA